MPYLQFGGVTRQSYIIMFQFSPVEIIKVNMNAVSNFE
jgi:hypothetical protein